MTVERGDASAVDEKPLSDSGLPLSLKALGAILGSTTAMAALLFYFGWSRGYYFYAYFGVDSSVLNLTTQDYIQMSVDGLFVPLIVTACVALVVLWLRPGVVWRLESSSRTRTAAIVAIVVGTALLTNGLSRIVVRTPLNDALVVAPLCLAVGAILLFSGVRLLRRVRATSNAVPPSVSASEWAALMVLLGLGLFWIANDYSAEVGQTRARQLVSELPAMPAAQVFAAGSLGIEGPDVVETRCAHAEAAYLYRYDGLKLVLHSGDVYLLLPGEWSRTQGVAVLLSRDDDTRLQFFPPGVEPDPASPC